MSNVTARITTIVVLPVLACLETYIFGCKCAHSDAMNPKNALYRTHDRASPLFYPILHSGTGNEAKSISVTAIQIYTTEKNLK